MPRAKRGVRSFSRAFTAVHTLIYLVLLPATPQQPPNRVIALKEAVNKGDFDVLKKEDGAVRLFNSGGFAMNKPQQKKVQAAYKDVQDAVAKKDSAALKSAWGTYFKTAGLDKTNPFSLKDAGQAYSADFDFRLVWG